MKKKVEEKFEFPIFEEEPPWRLLGQTPEKNTSNSKEEIFNQEKEGELSVDVYEKPEEIVVKSTIAGVSKNDLEISLVNDMLTIRGHRKLDEDLNATNYYFRECYWGKFSRSIILPVNVDARKTKAQIKNGVLTIILPKITRDSEAIRIKEIE